MDRLLRLDKERFIREMLAEAERAFRQVADAVNDAPDGNVINGSEMQVRDVMSLLRQASFEKAVQMRIDSTESSFSPSGGSTGQAQAQQGAVPADGADDQRQDRDPPRPLARRGRGRRHAT